MKKIFLIIISILVFNINLYVNAEEFVKHEVKLVRCDSTKNIWIKDDKKTKRINLISYDKEDGSLNKEIDSYICSLLGSAKKIEIEYDMEDLDKYNRELVHVFIDGNYLQKILIEKGYGQVNYIKGNYKYLDDLCEIQKNAIINGLGIWNYDKIEEKYCNSNVQIGIIKKEEIKEEQEKEKKDNTFLYQIIFINSGVLLLILLLIGKKNGKR